MGKLKLIKREFSIDEFTRRHYFLASKVLNDSYCMSYSYRYDILVSLRLLTCAIGSSQAHTVTHTKRSMANAFLGSLTNSVEPDKTPLNAASHQDLHCFPRLTHSW